VFNGKRVLVAGGAGLAGSHLIERLLSCGARIRSTIYKNKPVIKDSSIEYVSCDLTQSKDCDTVVKNVECVFMCAANTSGAAVMEQSPLVHVTPNVVMNSLMLDASHKAGVKKFVFLSSSVVYPLSVMPMKEEDFTGDMFDKYFCAGWSKRFAEILCKMYSTKAKRNMKTLVIRPGNLYGERDDFGWETSHALPALIRKVVERHDPVEVWGDGNDIRDLIYVKDFVNCLVSLASQETNDFDIVNVASGEAVSIKTVLKIILEEDGYKNAHVVFNFNKPSMIPERRIDISKLKTKLNKTCEFSLREGIRNTIQWYKDEFQK